MPRPKPVLLLILDGWGHRDDPADNAIAQATLPKDTNGAALLLKANNAAPLEGIGTVIDRTKNTIVCVYDFSVLGGAVGDINLLDSQGQPCILPQKAVVSNVVTSTQTLFATSTGGSFALKLLTTADLKAAVPAASMDATTPFDAGVPVGTAATLVGPITAALGTYVKASITSGDLTAGKTNVFIDYWIQP